MQNLWGEITETGQFCRLYGRSEGGEITTTYKCAVFSLFES